MPILDVQQETASRNEIGQLQLERLQATLNRVMRHVAFYRDWMKETDVLPSDFRTLDDLVRLPLIDRHTLEENQPYGFFAVPMREVVRLHPGHVGVRVPIVIGHTKDDVQMWTHLKARGFAAAEFTQNDMVQVYLDFSLFPGAVVANYGAERLGACVTPLYNMPIPDQIDIMRKFRTTILICTLSRALRIIRFMEEHAIDPKSLFLRSIVLVSECWSREQKRGIQDALEIDVYGNFGVYEICSPGIAFDCGREGGLHINEDHFLPEIIDPQSGVILPPGDRGELVLTTLTKEAFPLIRYRTGNITSLSYDVCECGRTLVRMQPVTARADGLISVEGVEFLPSDIGDILSKQEDVTAHYRLRIVSDETRDRLEIDVEMTPGIFQGDTVRSLESLCARLEETFFDRLRLPVTVKLVRPQSLAGQVQVEDLRNALR